MKKKFLILIMVLSAISLKAQTSDLRNTIQQLVTTKYVLNCPLLNYDVCLSPYLELDEVVIKYNSLNHYTLSQIHSIYYVVATENRKAKEVCLVAGMQAHYGIIKIYTNTYTGDKNHIKTTEYPINRWIW